MRQAHEEEKVQISERERQRARENLERQLLTIEQENQVARDRLDYEKRSEIERQEEHLEYLKESHKTQIRNLETLHADNMSSNMEEWKAKLMNMQKQKEVDIEIEQQKVGKIIVELIHVFFTGRTENKPIQIRVREGIRWKIQTVRSEITSQSQS